MSVPIPSENVRHKTLAKSEFKKMKSAGFQKCLLVVLVLVWFQISEEPSSGPLSRPAGPKFVLQNQNSIPVFQNQKTVIFYFAFFLKNYGIRIPVLFATFSSRLFAFCGPVFGWQTKRSPTY